MMKKITAFFLFYLVAVLAVAGPISREQAAEIAKSYLQKNRASRSVGQQAEVCLAYECLPKIARSAGVTSPLYYVFNQGKKEGFVVVAGDDRMTEVLGYVDRGSFVKQEVNPSLQWWLDAMEATMLSVVQSKSELTSFRTMADDGLKTSVPPLVTTHWGQNTPYNDRCPVDAWHGNQKSLVGCGAVAVAQVLSRWSYPTHPAGYIDYSTDRHHIHLSEDLRNFTFHWDRMLPEYPDGVGSVSERDAVAELMYACGLALKMDYCANESGSFITGKRMQEHFGMDPACNDIRRIFFSRSEWDHIVKTELSEGRPVVYCGHTLDAGHAFVCDGYNSDGLFHINWGWNGSQDGYFALAELNSAAERAGEPTDAEGGYNLDQEIVMGIQPKVGEGNAPVHTLNFYNIKPVGSASRNHVAVEMTNVGSDGQGFDGIASLAIFNGSGDFVSFLEGVVEVTIDPNAWFYYKKLTCSLPAEVEDGDYMVLPVSQANGDENVYFMRGRQSAPYVSFLVMSVDGNRVSLNSPSMVDADLKVVSVRCLNEKCYAGAENPLEIVIRNDGASYCGPLVFTRGSASEGRRVSSNNYIIEHGEECTIRIKVTAPQGQSRDVLNMYMAKDDDDPFHANGFTYGFVQQFEYDLTPTTPGTPRLSLDEFKIKNELLAVGEPLEVKVSLSNSGGFYNGQLDAYIFPSEGGSSLKHAKHKMFLDNGESENFTLKISTEGLGEGKYAVLPYIDNHQVGSTWYYFSILSNGEIKVETAEGYAVLCLQRAFEVPYGMKCGVVTYADDENMKIDYRYETGDVVPAGTPLIVCVDSPGTYPYDWANSTAAKPSDNLLRTEVNEDGYTYAGDGSYWYYGFGWQENYEECGFYAYDEYGSPFLLPNQQCYLAMPAGYGAPYYPFKMATGIRDLVMDAEISAGKPIYNLSGARVYGKLQELPKGVYIVGGKKVLVK